MQPEALAWALAQSAGSQWRALADAFASGTEQVTFTDGRSVRYRSLDEIATAISTGYATSATTTRRPTMTIARAGSGFA